MSVKNSEMSAADPNMTADVPEGEEEAAGTVFTPVFDFASWLQGVKPIKRTVALYSRLDLLAERDQLAIDLNDVKYVDQKQAEVLRARIEDVTEQILSSRLLVTVQALTTTRFRELLDDIKENYGDDDERAAFDMWAAQIVEPAGITGEYLQTLDEVSPTQCAKIAQAIQQINNAVPDVRATVPLL